MKRYLYFTVLVFLLSSLITTSILAFSGCKSTGPNQTLKTPAPADSTLAAKLAVDSGKPIEITVAYFPPPVIPLARGWEAWGHDVETTSGGKIKFNFKGGASMGAPADHFKLCTSGTADMVMTCPEFTPGVFPMSSAANLPMIFPSTMVSSGALYQYHKKYTAENDFKDVVFLASLPTAPAQLHSRTKQVKTLEDLKGLKIITMSDQQAKIITALGASPVVMTEGEAYTAMERGLADARFKEWDGTMTWKINEVTKYRTTNIDLGMDQMILIANRDFWNKLPADIQNLLKGATGLFLSHYHGMVYDRANNQNYELLVAYDKKVGNPEMYALPDEEKQKWVQAVEPIRAQWVKDMEAAGRPGTAALQDLLNWIEQYKEIYSYYQ